MPHVTIGQFNLYYEITRDGKHPVPRAVARDGKQSERVSLKA